MFPEYFINSLMNGLFKKRSLNEITKCFDYEANQEALSNNVSSSIFKENSLKKLSINYKKLDNHKSEREIKFELECKSLCKKFSKFKATNVISQSNKSGSNSSHFSSKNSSLNENYQIYNLKYNNSINQNLMMIDEKESFLPESISDDSFLDLIPSKVKINEGFAELFKYEINDKLYSSLFSETNLVNTSIFTSNILQSISYFSNSIQINVYSNLNLKNISRNQQVFDFFYLKCLEEYTIYRLFKVFILSSIPPLIAYLRNKMKYKTNSSNKNNEELFENVELKFTKSHIYNNIFNQLLLDDISFSKKDQDSIKLKLKSLLRKKQKIGNNFLKIQSDTTSFENSTCSSNPSSITSDMLKVYSLCDNYFDLSLNEYIFHMGGKIIDKKNQFEKRRNNNHLC